HSGNLRTDIDVTPSRASAGCDSCRIHLPRFPLSIAASTLRTSGSISKGAWRRGSLGIDQDGGRDRARPDRACHSPGDRRALRRAPPADASRPYVPTLLAAPTTPTSAPFSPTMTINTSHEQTAYSPKNREFDAPFHRHHAFRQNGHRKGRNIRRHP